MPLGVAKFGAKALHILLKILVHIGIEAKMPAELMFLDQFYDTQTLDGTKLRSSSFTDHCPEETIYSKLPEIIEYYITRWEHHNLLSGYNDDFFDPHEDIRQFIDRPQDLLKQIHNGKTKPFGEFRTLDNAPRKTPDE